MCLSSFCFFFFAKMPFSGRKGPFFIFCKEFGAEYADLYELGAFRKK